MGPIVLLASLACELHDRRQKDRLSCSGVPLGQKFREEVRRVEWGANSDDDSTLPAKQRDDDVLPDGNGHEGPFFADNQIRINSSKTFLNNNNNKKKEGGVSTVHTCVCVCGKKKRKMLVSGEKSFFFSKKSQTREHKGVQRAIQPSQDPPHSHSQSLMSHWARFHPRIP